MSVKIFRYAHFSVSLLVMFCLCSPDRSRNLLSVCPMCWQSVGCCDVNLFTLCHVNEIVNCA